MTTQPTVSISPNPIKEKVLIDANGRQVPMNQGLRQAQRDLQNAPLPKKEK